MVTVKNPILTGFYPDPSICRVGRFLSGNIQFCICTRCSAVSQQGSGTLGANRKYSAEKRAACCWGRGDFRGIYALTIRYHKGIYYMITTNVSYGGNFIVTAEHPEGRGQIPVIWEKKQPGLIPACF